MMLASDRDVAAEREQAGGQARVELGEPLETLRRFLVELLDRLADLEQFGRAVIGGIEAVLRAVLSISMPRRPSRSAA